MTTSTPIKSKSTIEKLIEFANTKPGLDFNDYGDYTSYSKESREITKDLHDFRELLALAFRRVDNLDEMVKNVLSGSDRLSLNDKGNLIYTAGQYFPTEYRPAACAVLNGLFGTITLMRKVKAVNTFIKLVTRSEKRLKNMFHAALLNIISHKQYKKYN